MKKYLVIFLGLFFSVESVTAQNNLANGQPVQIATMDSYGYLHVQHSKQRFTGTRADLLATFCSDKVKQPIRRDMVNLVWIRDMANACQPFKNFEYVSVFKRSRFMFSKLFYWKIVKKSTVKLAKKNFLVQE